VALFRLPSGQYAAVDAICPHQGGALELGAIEECDKSISVLCPRHAWAFDLSTGFCDLIGTLGSFREETCGRPIRCLALVCPTAHSKGLTAGLATRTGDYGVQAYATAVTPEGVVSAGGV